MYEMRRLTSSPTLMLTWLTLLIVLMSADALKIRSKMNGRPQAGRGFHQHNCQGNYNVSSFRLLDKICDDCYGLYWEPELDGLCRHDCFSSTYFHGCMVALQMEARVEQYSRIILKFGGKPLRLLPD